MYFEWNRGFLFIFIYFFLTSGTMSSLMYFIDFLSPFLTYEPGWYNGIKVAQRLPVVFLHKCIVSIETSRFLSHTFSKL